MFDSLSTAIMGLSGEGVIAGALAETRKNPARRTGRGL